VNGTDENTVEGSSCFEVLTTSITKLKERCDALKFPLLEEYDFKNDKSNPDLPFALKTDYTIRDYQEQSLSRMFNSERARSGKKNLNYKKTNKNS
jgi:DNA excision repair protein ERCC-3